MCNYTRHFKLVPTSRCCCLFWNCGWVNTCFARTCCAARVQGSVIWAWRQSFLTNYKTRINEDTAYIVQALFLMKAGRTLLCLGFSLLSYSNPNQSHSSSLNEPNQFFQSESEVMTYILKKWTVKGALQKMFKPFDVEYLIVNVMLHFLIY